ncbi:MAG: thioredoxin family protein [Dysgonamonadaceae bacterium]
MKRIIKFEKEDCRPCVLVNEFLSGKKISYEIVNPFDEPETAIKYKIRSVPTTLLLENEEVIMRVNGYQPEELRDMIEVYTL